MKNFMIKQMTYKMNLIEKLMTRLSLIGLLGLLSTFAYANTLDEITFATLPGDRVQIKLTMSEAAIEPGSFTIDNPARIALDFPGTTSRLSSKKQNINVGVAQSITAVEAGGRTRVVINLDKMVPYQTSIEGNSVLIALNSSGVVGVEEVTANLPTQIQNKTVATENDLKKVDFRRGEKGEGRVVLTLGDPGTPVDMRRLGNQVIVTVQKSGLPEEFERRLDVLDFATPVRTVDAFTHGTDVRVVITSVGEFDHLAYQTDDRFTIDVKPIIKDPEAEKKKKKFEYEGERLSLNFQNIEVRAVLQLIADFTGINMVTSDSVEGTLTLRLKNVPWDQALDMILKTKGLDQRREGNVMMIAPAEEIAAREKLELEANKQIEELAPLYSETIQVNYAKATTIASLVTKQKNILTERGSINVDERTNKLFISDVEERINLIRSLVGELDVPVKQVLIESRIVIARDDFSKELGVRFGVTSIKQSADGNVTAIGGDATAANALVTQAHTNINNNNNPFPITTLPNQANRYNVDLPTVSQFGSIALAVLNANTLVDLELSALQTEGKGKIVSNPRVITSNSHKALIEQGVEIPYAEASSSGATTISFKKAVLKLEVTPQITPDNRVVMDLQVNKDSVGEVFGGIPSIDTREVQTQILVDNGQTVVLGGIYEQEKTTETDRVPFFGDLPIIGALFRQTREIDDKSELLIFVTPKILKGHQVF